MTDSAWGERKQQARLKRMIQSKRVRRFTANRTAVIGGWLMLLLISASLLTPWLARFEPQAVDVIQRLKPPSLTHYFGTDNLGRDVFSRTLSGMGISIQVGLTVAIISSTAGLAIGLYSAYYRRLDQVLMRIMDGIFAFPAVLLAMAMMAALGPNVSNLIICLSIVFIPAVARIVRSSALVVKEQTYIEAMRAIGASRARIVWLHIMPGTLPALIVQGSFVFAESIIVEAALSFLGAGIPAPMPSLGNLLSEGKAFIYNSWWMTLFPGFALIICVLAMNWFGDGLRDMLDPYGKTKRSRKTRKRSGSAQSAS
ncbi:ABC transporter permease [Paenibacillus sinopodophylli]|uniref:ABC transporter permease n=1 Tax=Paenibacillus sinopodophylli TaxID=1837342 RepID=UPI001FE8B84E|nr:ABC transporter permease [Paenibacillus sinopodophylli]